MKRLLALILAVLMLLCCGCTPSDAAVTVTPEPTPTPMPDVPIMAETVVTKLQGELVPVDVPVVIHGEEEIIPMTPVSGSFKTDGGPDFTLLVDRSRYVVNDVGGCCYVTLATGMSGDVYAEIGFRPNVRAADIGTEILDEYGIMGVKEEPADEWLGNNRVRHIHGETVQNVFDVYLIDTEGGTLTAVLSTTTQTKAHYARLMASLESLEIFE